MSPEAIATLKRVQAAMEALDKHAEGCLVYREVEASGVELDRLCDIGRDLSQSMSDAWDKA